MEEKKKPFWKKWAQRIGLALGITASTLALGTRDANANEIVTEDKNDIKAADTIDQSATSEDALSRLESLIAKNNQMLGEKGNAAVGKTIDTGNQLSKTANEISNFANSVNNVEKAAQNIGNSSNLNSVVNNVKSVQNAWDKATEQFNNVNDEFTKTDKAVSQVLSTDTTSIIKDDKTQNNDEITQANISDDETIAKEIISRTHFKSIKYNPYDMEVALSDEITSLNQKISEANANDNKELAHFLTVRRDDLRNQRIAITNARINDGVQPEILSDSYEYKSRNITPEKADELTAFANNVKDNWTPGQTSAHFSEGITELDISISQFIQNNNPDSYSISDRANYYSILRHLLETYEGAKKVSKVLQEEAKAHPNDPEYKIELPPEDIKTVENAVSQAIKNAKTEMQNTPKVEKTEKAEKVEVKSSNKSIFKELPPQVYVPSQEYIAKQETMKTADTTTQAKSQTQNTTPQISMEALSRRHKQLSTKIAQLGRQQLIAKRSGNTAEYQKIHREMVNINNQLNKLKQQILEAKENQKQQNQAPTADKKTVETAKPNQTDKNQTNTNKNEKVNTPNVSNTPVIDESKLHDVSFGQMGIFEDVDQLEKVDLNAPYFDALFNVSEGQMGIWNEIEDILDEDTEKQEQAKNKSKDDDDDFVK